MRAWKAVAVALLFGAGILGRADGSSYVERLQGGRLENLHVRRFRIGTLEPNTDRFLPLGGRDATEMPRDAILLIEFSGPVDFESLNSRTVRIGIPTSPGLILPAKGAFYRHTEKEFFSGQFVPRRTYRNHVLFDPTARWEIPLRSNPDGLDANCLFTVSIPGADEGATKTVTTRRGAPLRSSFRTTFRTADTYGRYTPPVEGAEARSSTPR